LNLVIQRRAAHAACNSDAELRDESGSENGATAIE
jgi:hypothetical protein